MINPNISRIGTFGASDTKYMMMGFHTNGFQKWWLEKTGQIESDFVDNKYTRAGSLLEHPILKAVTGIIFRESFQSYSGNLEPERLNYMENDKVAKHKDFPLLTVSLDGVYHKGIGWYDWEYTIYEVKTTSYENVFWGKVSSEKDHIKQVQVQMFATGFRKAFLVYYGLLPSEYEIEFLLDPVIDFNRIKLVEVPYDAEWIDECYIPRLQYLSECLEKGEVPV